MVARGRVFLAYPADLDVLATRQVFLRCDGLGKAPCARRKLVRSFSFYGSCLPPFCGSAKSPFSRSGLGPFSNKIFRGVLPGTPLPIPRLPGPLYRSHASGCGSVLSRRFATLRRVVGECFGRSPLTRASLSTSPFPYSRLCVVRSFLYSTHIFFSKHIVAVASLHERLAAR